MADKEYRLPQRAILVYLKDNGRDEIDLGAGEIISAEVREDHGGNWIFVTVRTPEEKN